jgi:hypothetical protein
MIIPLCRGIKPIIRWSQSINYKITNEILRQDDTMIFYLGSLATGKLVLIVAIHSLGGSQAYRHHTSNPLSGVAQSTQDEDHTSHKQSTRVYFGSPLGKGQEPLTITTIRAKDKHLSPLNDPRYSKLSRWQKPPRVTSESHSETQSPSASRCNNSSNALRFTPNLTKMMNQ